MAENLRERVSVIIPARNEEANIACAVRSVASQQGIREIIAVDDGSTDRTGEILEELRREIPALRTIRIDALPEGWTGKSHAAAMGARTAAAEWLLFTDADTVHRAGSLPALLERAERERADLLSISPGQCVPTWWEKSVIPLVYVHLARLYRFEDVSDPNSPAAAANGQYLLVRRDAYERADGHEAVRAEILEDVELARRIKRAGGRLIFLPGAEWVETRMYRTFAQMWQGWTKNLYLLYNCRMGRVWGTLVELTFLDLALPLVFFLLCVAIVVGRGSMGLALAAVGVLGAALARQWSYSSALERLGFGPLLANYLFPGACLFSLLLVNSVLSHRWKRRVRWKGREYPARAPQKEGK
jgi:cellulose synthase/poly-beta-1,6-N-acetylglucosamine synthase-like glycosyltransferase